MLRAPLLAMNRASCESRVTERTADLIWLRLIDGVPVDFWIVRNATENLCRLVYTRLLELRGAPVQR
jgi:hypothetical protein